MTLLLQVQMFFFFFKSVRLWLGGGMHSPSPDLNTVAYVGSWVWWVLLVPTRGTAPHPGSR